ncbi:MAG: hypothetical protein COB26_04545 [Piscirickettsiaceae bacterium]|nr:MAG: hypothetical protein COB26_04545 [Piscirickettsiaceae bacterium]
MSLLLDALKQAEENKKNMSADEGMSVAESAQTDAVALVLEDEPVPQVEPIEKVRDSVEEKVTVTAQPVEEVRASNILPSQAPLDPSLNVFSAGGGRQGSQNKKHLITGLLLLIISVMAAYWVMSEQSIQLAMQDNSVIEGDEESIGPLTVELNTSSEKTNVNPEVKKESVERPVAIHEAIRDAKPINTHVKRSTGISIKKSRMSASLSAALNKGYAALQNGRYSEATLTYQAILKKRPKQIDALLGLANIYAHNGDLLAARRQYDEALVIRPSNKIAQLGLLYTYQSDNSTKGLELLQNLSAKYPNNPEILVAIGHKLAKQSKWFAAQQSYFKAYSVQPSNALLAYNLAVSLDRMEKYDAASSFYNKALTLNSVSAPVVNSQQIKNRLLEIGGNK